MTEKEQAEEVVRKMSYYSTEIAKLVKNISPSCARQIKQICTQIKPDHQNIDFFLEKLHKEGQEIPDLQRLSRLFEGEIKHSCCLLHACVLIVNAFLVQKIEEEVPQSSSLH